MPKRPSAKRPGHEGESEVNRLAEEFRLRIDPAMNAIALLLETGIHLLVAIDSRKADTETKQAIAEPSLGGSVPDAMTSRQAAKYLGVKDQTLALWRCTGRHALPFAKVGRKVVYRKADLDRFIQEHTFNRGGAAR